MVEENLMTAVKAITDHDSELADRVIDTDPEIDALEVEVEEECLKILALHQPVAADLRYVIAVLKINNDLERIGDLAVSVAKRAKTVANYSKVSIPFDLNSMLATTVNMVKDSVDSLVYEDVDKANKVLIADDKVDRLHSGSFELVQEQIRQKTDFADYYVSLLGVSKNLERIADHATNIAEDVIYLISGVIVRHQGM
jgi:phosphate transport system protein